MTTRIRRQGRLKVRRNGADREDSQHWNHLENTAQMNGQGLSCSIATETAKPRHGT